MEKQETIEKAAEKTFTPAYTNYKVRRHGFIEGAKWQAERMYSREEVVELLHKVIKDCDSEELLEHYSGDYSNLNNWIQQNLK